MSAYRSLEHLCLIIIHVHLFSPQLPCVSLWLFLYVEASLWLTSPDYSLPPWHLLRGPASTCLLDLFVCGYSGVLVNLNVFYYRNLWDVIRLAKQFRIDENAGKSDWQTDMFGWCDLLSEANSFEEARPSASSIFILITLVLTSKIALIIPESSLTDLFPNISLTSSQTSLVPSNLLPVMNARS